MPRRFRAFTSVTGMVLLLPKNRRARSGSRSPHQTVCPWRSSNCARSEPVAPAPKTKIRMAWAKLYHNSNAFLRLCRQCHGIALISIQEYTYGRNSDPCCLQENQPRAAGATSQEVIGLRVRVETPAPPAFGKERFTGNLQISGLRPIPTLDSGGSVLGACESVFFA